MKWAAPFGLLLALACAPSPPVAVEIPQPEMEEMEPQVAKRLREVREAVVRDRDSASAWGRFGMVAHAHEMWEEAQICYRQAEFLEPDNIRWPYYLGDVLSIVGTDLAGAERAFRRALLVDPEYGPAHMRLGNVLVAQDRNQEAGLEFERALELSPELEPARVALAQIRLAQGAFEDAEILLEKVLQSSPRHGQALATLGQVLMRQDRREEARRIAELARDPAAYNLFEDPLKSEVVAEGVSAVQIWERAKSFLEVGNYEQAVLGLRQVLDLLPEDAEVHLQLAVAHGNLGQLELARHHFERSVMFDDENAETRIRLASLELELGHAAAAVSQLERSIELAPEKAEPAWLLAKARLVAGDPEGALVAFERAAARGFEPPAWAHNDWGSVLAQSGRTEAALSHFRAALEVDPENSQALFYIGLVFEGQGRIDQAVRFYRQALEQGSNPVIAARLDALSRQRR